MIDIGPGVHYSAVQPGTPVYSDDEVEVGVVEVVLDNYEEHIFDGVVFKDLEGVQRFADAPEVARTAERGVVLAISAEEAKRLGPPEEGHAKFKPNRRAGRLSRFFGTGWKRH
ncbi:MAG TPA: hypothetical protein VNO20_06640 [Solirubrobacterales bacterium]|nr:hypothetical protein [Solirubrobacterales bacterium]